MAKSSNNSQEKSYNLVVQNSLPDNKIDCGQLHACHTVVYQVGGCSNEDFKTTSYIFKDSTCIKTAGHQCSALLQDYLQVYYIKPRNNSSPK